MTKTHREKYQEDIVKRGRGRMRIGVGIDKAGNIIYTDIEKTPKIIIMGSTGSGMTCLSSSIIYRGMSWRKV